MDVNKQNTSISSYMDVNLHDNLQKCKQTKYIDNLEKCKQTKYIDIPT